ncbi:flagellar hook-associated protein FlgK [Shewanella sp. NIFS-20-20]|uniref:flagellar hook-associated protein FlgK n=1 Tax=Shewanella sp. NIFS-20-20 TaxID=2853806 RepID=UPI001C489A27|nr:flagellar hook-associated protein FlgK [Shewanella sp. NIFS-20-20]MBV7314780.1 flagellar hook-associated protein FlgK [Shewanella sp. NIFS-20-20]
MSVDLMNIARTGVMASQSQLGVTSNNIANVNTQGYHRQVAEQDTLGSQRIGGNFYGTGTYVSDVKRIYNDFAARELRIGQSTLSAAQTQDQKLSELDQIFSQLGQSIPNSLTNLFADINGLADLPSDLGIRGSVLNNASEVAKAINQLQSSVNSQMQQTNDQIIGITERVNEIGVELANINRELMKSSGQDMALLDHQDSLIQELSQYAQVNVIPLETGAKSIMLGGSMMLVSNQVPMSLGTEQGEPFAEEIALNATSGAQTVAVKGEQLGGQLGALFSYRDNSLLPAGRELGQLALGIAASLNDQQAQGLDANGQVGEPIFRDINDPLMAVGRVGVDSGNTGNAALSLDITDVNQLGGTEYQLKFTTAGGYQLTDTTTGATSTLTLTAGVLTGGPGFALNINSGAMADGDSFTLRPSAGAAAGIATVMTDAKGIAAAAPKMTPAAANSGNTELTLTAVTNKNAANFPTTGNELTLEINTGASTYEAFDANGTSLGSFAYTAPTISAFGFTLEVSSSGAATDSFTLDFSSHAGDNTNIEAMAQLADSKLMNNGKSTLSDVFENTKLDVGSQAKAADIKLGSASAILKQAQDRVDSESGVNLDEEAANLMRFQQSYQAAARIMTTAQQIFDTLLSSVR